ncbi:MAG: two pore domain potassium channel family protein [Armatimonadetes bacterium]|nr:two pore domain potassium channel family protein [Armatimonadota bacterium]
MIFLNGLLALLGIYLIGTALVDMFTSILLPRTVNAHNRFAAVYYRFTWRHYSRFAEKRKAKDAWLAFFGPLSLLILFALWAGLMIVGFALLMVGMQLPLQGGEPNLPTSLYASGVTFFTLGFGDVVATSGFGRTLCVLEAGVGFAFLAIAISYLPVIYQSFSRREAQILLLDARAGSPACAVEFITRYTSVGDFEGLREHLIQWERWAAELLEGTLSYPVLAFYRSQHSTDSWLAAVTMIMDSCALLRANMDGAPHECTRLLRQAELTFAMSRHAVVDLCLIYGMKPEPPNPPRLSEEEFDRIAEYVSERGYVVRDVVGTRAKLEEIRSYYEPYVHRMAYGFSLTLPTWMPEPGAMDNWQTSSYGNVMHL